VKSDILLHLTLISGFQQLLISVDPRGIQNYNEVMVHKYPVVHKTAQQNLVTLFQSLLSSINNVLYQVLYSFIITGRNKRWTGHAEDKHVKFYEENLKVRDITWKN
jgi:hypothetical protein